MSGVMYWSYINKSHFKIVETFTAVGVLPVYSLCKVQLPFLIFRSLPRFFPDYQPVMLLSCHPLFHNIPITQPSTNDYYSYPLSSPGRLNRIKLNTNLKSFTLLICFSPGLNCHYYSLQLQTHPT